MAVALTDLVTPVAQSAMLTQLLGIANTLGLPTTSWQAGQPLRTMLNTVAQKLADFSSVAVAITQGGFGDLLPSDGWADIWAQSRFNVQRVQAVAATGLVALGNTSVTTYTLAIGDMIIAHATTGATYRNIAALSVPPGGVASVAIQADVVGTGSNASPGTVTTVVSSYPGVTSTNAASVLGGDAETTLALVTRARAKLGALSPNGPRDAYNYVATTPTLSVGLSSPITRTRTVADPATGLISVYLATASGAPVAGDVTIVQTAINTYAQPWCVTATAIAATPHVVPITYTAYVKGSQLTSAQIQTAIGNALATWFSTLAIGGYVIPPDTGAVYVDALQQVMGAATPGILRVVITVPAATVVILSSEVATLGTVTPTITFL